jgi:C-terminal processing protease CtpA/Prc
VGNGLIGFARLNSGIGYLRLEAFDNYSAQDNYLAQREVFDQALTTVFDTPMTGLVIDVRYNLGGYDDLGLRLAARLTDRPYPAYAKQVWTGTSRSPSRSRSRPPAPGASPDRSRY